MRPFCPGNMATAGRAWRTQSNANTALEKCLVAVGIGIGMAGCTTAARERTSDSYGCYRRCAGVWGPRILDVDALWCAEGEAEEPTPGSRGRRVLMIVRGETSVTYAARKMA